ncbi:MAG: hypothetical protein IJK77_07640 [Lachnospiraceae bacterium]|nr:hypothetical protein [Lachnospiraceae bacterium]
MRVFGKECRKLFRPGRSLGLLLFMAAALVLISRTAQFPDTHDKAYEELVKEYGPTLDQAEYQTLLKAKSVYIEELGGEGWSRDRVHWAEIMADESKRQFVFLVDAIERIEEEIQFGYGFAFEKEPTETLKEQLRSCTPQEAARILFIVQTKELPLSSPGICEIMESDPLLLLILVLIGCGVLILPYQLLDKNLETASLMVSTRVGRRIFHLKIRACAAAGAAAAFVAALLHLALLWLNGVMIFWNVPVCGLGLRGIPFWVDLTFGQYLLLWIGLLVLAGITAALLCALAARLSGSFITALTLALPALAIYGWGIHACTAVPLSLWYGDTFPASLFRTAGVPLLVLAALTLASEIVLRLDARRDIL